MKVVYVSYSDEGTSVPAGAENALGLRERLESGGHQLVTTTETGKKLDGELADAEVLVRTPFWPVYLDGRLPRRVAGGVLVSDDAAQETLGEDMLVFVQRVRGEAALERDVDAEVLTRATMRALGTQITGEASTGLTTGLPEELVAELDAHTPGDQADFDRGVFLDRVAGELEGSDGSERSAALEARVRAVLAVVREWAPAGRLEDTLAHLPAPLAAMSPEPHRSEPDGAAGTATRRQRRWCCPRFATPRAC